MNTIKTELEEPCFSFTKMLEHSTQGHDYLLILKGKPNHYLIGNLLNLKLLEKKEFAIDSIAKLVEKESLKRKSKEFIRNHMDPLGCINWWVKECESTRFRAYTAWGPLYTSPTWYISYTAFVHENKLLLDSDSRCSRLITWTAVNGFLTKLLLFWIVKALIHKFGWVFHANLYIKSRIKLANSSYSGLFWIPIEHTIVESKLLWLWSITRVKWKMAKQSRTWKNQWGNCVQFM